MILTRGNTFRKRVSARFFTTQGMVASLKIFRSSHTPTCCPRWPPRGFIPAFFGTSPLLRSTCSSAIGTCARAFRNVHQRRHLVEEMFAITEFRKSLWKTHRAAAIGRRSRKRAPSKGIRTTSRGVVEILARWRKGFICFLLGALFAWRSRNRPPPERIQAPGANVVSVGLRLRSICSGDFASLK